MNKVVVADDDQDIMEFLGNRVSICEATPSVLICVYGTLRQGEGNWRYHLANTKSELLGTYQSEPKFTMYGRRAGFPVLTEGNTSITYEVWRISESKVLESLHNLEGCTGVPGDEDNWYDIVPMDTPHGPGWIYLQHDFKHAETSVIPTGDWKNKSL